MKPTSAEAMAATAPVYPGDELVTGIWRDVEHASFQTRSLASGEIVLASGRAEIAGPV